MVNFDDCFLLDGHEPELPKPTRKESRKETPEISGKEKDWQVQVDLCFADLELTPQDLW